jgi:hypothetical protein
LERFTNSFPITNQTCDSTIETKTNTRRQHNEKKETTYNKIKPGNAFIVDIASSQKEKGWPSK